MERCDSCLGRGGVVFGRLEVLRGPFHHGQGGDADGAVVDHARDHAALFIATVEGGGQGRVRDDVDAGVEGIDDAGGAHGVRDAEEGVFFRVLDERFHGGEVEAPEGGFAGVWGAGVWGVSNHFDVVGAFGYALGDEEFGGFGIRDGALGGPIAQALVLGGVAGGEEVGETG